MSKLADLNQTVFVPIVDEAHGTSYEMQMTISELLENTLEGFEPEIIESIPAKWLKEKANQKLIIKGNPFEYVQAAWQNEQNQSV